MELTLDITNIHNDIQKKINKHTQIHNLHTLL